MGFISKRSPGSYRICVEAPRDPGSGRRRQVWETVKGSRAAAKARMDELERGIRQGGFVEQTRITVGEWLLRWHSSWVTRNLKKQTSDSYAMEIRNHLAPKLGAVLLQKLSRQHLEDYIESNLEAGAMSGGGGLSRATVRYHLNVLSGALEYAVKQGYLARNVVHAVDLPSPERKPVETMKRRDVPRFLEAAVAVGALYHALFYLALYTGMRLGEILALRWSEVDLELGFISVIRSLYKRGRVEIGEPKSQSSRRRISMPASLAAVLRGHRKEQEANGVLLGRPLEEADLVFAYPGNRPLDPSTVYHTFQKTLKRAAIPRIRFHDLRHTHASLLFAANIHPKIVSERLGHSSVSFTLDIYSHLVPGLQEDAAEQLDRFLSPERGHTVKHDNPGIVEEKPHVAIPLPDALKEWMKRGGFEREPHRNRTCNLLIKSQLLCQLS